MKKHIAIVLLFAFIFSYFMMPSVSSEYTEDNPYYSLVSEYDADEDRIVVEAYLKTKQDIICGTFGVRYNSDIATDATFVLDENNFAYASNSKFDMGYQNTQQEYEAFIWYMNDVYDYTDADEDGWKTFHLGTFTVAKASEKVEYYDTFRVLNWNDTPESIDSMFTNTDDSVCLNDEIWRDATSEEKALDSDLHGYYQGYDMTDENNPEFVDIGFKYTAYNPIGSPAIDTVIVKPVVNGVAGDAEDLLDSTYTNIVDFDNASNPTRDEYYVLIEDADADKVEFTVTTKEADTIITAPDGITVTENNDGTWTVTAPITSGVNEIVLTLTLGNVSLDYTFYVKKDGVMVEPRIEFNYGNSPVGMIMSDDTISDKEAAIADFKSTRIFSGVTNNLQYYEDAWYHYKGKGENGADYNGDDDPTAMFVYQRDNFRDVGFTAYDSTGAQVNPSDVSVTCTVTAYKGGFAKYDSSDNTENVVLQRTGNDLLFTEFSNYNIRPDVYDMEYKFTDTDGTEVKAIRKLIVISRTGDVCIDANNALNNLDSSGLSSNITAMATVESNNSLYKFRVADVRMDENKVINNLDASAITIGVANGLPTFYEHLSTN